MAKGWSFCRDLRDFRQEKQKFAALEDGYRSKRELLEEAIVDYSDKNGCDVVIGSDIKAVVKRAEVESYPGSGSKERTAFVDLVKELGLWEEAASLNIKGLPKVLQSSVLAEDQLQKIYKFRTVNEEVKVSLNKLKNNEK